MPETTSQIFSHILSGVAGGLIVALIQSLMSRSSERVLKREADISADKLEFIPLIDSFIERAGCDPTPNRVRRDSVQGLRDWQRRFRLHLTGRKLRAFAEAWNALEQTTEQEMIGSSGQAVFPDPQAGDFRKISQILITRLEAFRDTIHDP